MQDRKSRETGLGTPGLKHPAIFYTLYYTLMLSLFFQPGQFWARLICYLVCFAVSSKQDASDLRSVQQHVNSALDLLSSATHIVSVYVPGFTS